MAFDWRFVPYANAMVNWPKPTNLSRLAPAIQWPMRPCRTIARITVTEGSAPFKLQDLYGKFRKRVLIRVSLRQLHFRSDENTMVTSDRQQGFTGGPADTDQRATVWKPVLMSNAGHPLKNLPSGAVK
jgi:hypothetical protein